VNGEWYASFAGCLVGELGQIRRAFGSFEDGGFQQAALYAAGGASVHAEIPLHAHFYVQAAADVLEARKFVSASTTGVVLGQGSVGGPAGGIGVSLGVSF